MNDLRKLIDDLFDAKAIEEAAKQRRIALEELIAAEVPGPDRGQRTIAVDHYKVTVDRGFNYKADFQAIEDAMVNPLFPPPIKVKTTRELDVKGYEWYREQDPATFALLAQHVTVTPKKVSVTVKQGK